jgi:hypothetical protein
VKIAEEISKNTKNHGVRNNSEIESSGKIAGGGRNNNGR